MRWHTVAPIPIKRRPRFGNRRAFPDQRTVDDERRVAASYDGELYEGAVGIVVNIYKPLQKAARKPANFTQKPDVDNVLKAVMDGLSGVAYVDDNQVVKATVTKCPRMSRDEVERVEFCVYPMEVNKHGR